MLAASHRLLFSAIFVLHVMYLPTMSTMWMKLASACAMLICLRELFAPTSRS